MYKIYWPKDTPNKYEPPTVICLELCVVVQVENLLNKRHSTFWWFEVEVYLYAEHYFIVSCSIVYLEQRSMSFVHELFPCLKKHTFYIHKFIKKYANKIIFMDGRAPLEKKETFYIYAT